MNGTYNKRLKCGHVERGDWVSTDHYISAVPDQLEHTYGQENQGYSCGTLFVDHATGKIFNYCQLLTVASKDNLEKQAREEGFTIKSFHSDNGVFASKEFTDDCKRQDQKIDFSGVGVQHQNGVAERKTRQ